MKIRVLFLFASLLFSAQVFAQIISPTSVDFSGMDQFWLIESDLIKDIPPSDAQWNTFFETPAYQILLAGGFSREEFEHQLQLALMPSKATELTKELENDDQYSSLLHHYMRVKGMEEEMKKQQVQLQKNQLIETALSMAKSFLPDSFQYKNALPPVSFIIYENATTRSPSGIVIDLLYSIDFQSYIPYSIAHEAYHFFLDKIKRYQLPPKNHPEYPITQILNQLETEGIADQIDKKKFFLHKGLLANCNWAKSYQYYLSISPKIIHQLDEFFIHMATSPQSDTRIIQDIIPMNGHPTGYFMASAIIEKMGKRALIKETANPFAFFRLYNEVALKDKKHYPAFSDITMQYLDKLEKKYFPPKTPKQPERKSSPRPMWFEKDKVVNNW